MRAYFIGCTILFSAFYARPALAAVGVEDSLEQVSVARATDGRVRHFSLRAEAGLWVVESYTRANDGWPNREWHKAFPTRAQAEAAMEPFHPRRVSTRELSYRTELRGAPTSLWKVTESWNWDWELKYADWVQKNADPQFFVKYQIATDCADVAYSLRWIFARMNGLPAANRLATGKDLFTQDSVRTEWAKLPRADNWWEDKLFLAALAYLTDYTYTHTLIGDSYPIEVSQSALLAGTHFLTVRSVMGHTQYIHRTYYTDPKALPLRQIYSDVPKTVRPLYEEGFWNYEQPVVGRGGFLHFRWPVKDANGTSLLAGEKMPFYSAMQFEEKFMTGQTTFAFAVIQALKPGFDLTTWFTTVVSDLHDRLLSRKDVVEQGSLFCQTHDCQPGTPAYENWSTPNRDHQIRDMIRLIREVVSLFDEQLGSLWTTAQTQQVLLLNGVSYSLGNLLFIFDTPLPSPEPTVTLGERWSLEPAAMQSSLTKYLAKAIAARADKIKTQICEPSTCAISSPAWEKAVTSNEDDLIYGSRRFDGGYCDQLPGFCAIQPRISS